LPALAGLALTRITPRYTATASVIYEPSEYAARELQSILRVEPTSDTVMASQTEIIRGVAIAERLADRLRLHETAEFNASLRPASPLRRLFARFLGPPDAFTAEEMRRDVIQATQAAIVVRPVKASRVLEIGFGATSAALAASGANLVAELYIQDQLDAKVAAVRRANQWLETRIADLKREVRDAESRIAAYRSGQGLVQGVQAGLDTERLSRMNTDLLAARNDLAQVQGRLDAARGRGGAMAQAAVAPSVVQLRVRQDDLSAQLQSLLTRLGPNHPTARGLQNQQADAQRAVNAEIARVVAATEAEMRAARARVTGQEENLRNAQAELGDSAQAQIPLSAMERDAEASRTLLHTVLERFQQTAQQTAIERADARVISRALIPANPSSPRAALLLAAALVMGVLLGLVVAWLLELTDSTFRSGDEVRGVLSLPCYALIPELASLQLGRMRVADYVAHRPLSPFSEQLRGLRAGLWLGLKQPKVIAVTAARPDEGKTTVTLALARSAAMNGERVVVLDCDIRQPGLGRLLGADAVLGLTDLLLGHATLEQVMQQDSLTPMKIIAAGSAEVGSQNLFMSAPMEQLLASLRETHDLVLLDAPPAAAMIDARIIARLADTTMLCIRWHHTPRGVVRHAIDLLEQAQARIAGIALTRVDPKAHVRSGFSDAEVYHPRYGGYFRE
jgi:capsular exopolysaccharide synthesis family protein